VLGFLAIARFRHSPPSWQHCKSIEVYSTGVLACGKYLTFLTEYPTQINTRVCRPYRKVIDCEALPY